MKPRWTELAREASQLEEAGQLGKALSLYSQAIREAPRDGAKDLAEAEQLDSVADLFIRNAELQEKTRLRAAEDAGGMVCDFAAAYRGAEFVKTKHYRTPFHPEVARTLDRLAGVWRLCEPEAAAEYFESAVKARESSRQSGAEELAEAWDRLGDYRLHAMAEFRASRTAYEQARQLRVKAFGARDPRVTANASRAAWATYFGGDLAGARRLLEEAVRLREAAPGEGHAGAAALFEEMSGLLEAAGDEKGAALAGEKALSIREKQGDRGRQAQAMLRLAGLRRNQGDLNAALKLAEGAVSLMEAHLPPDSAELAEPLALLLDLLEETGRSGAAARVQRRLDELERGNR